MQILMILAQLRGRNLRVRTATFFSVRRRKNFLTKEILFPNWRNNFSQLIFYGLEFIGHCLLIL